METIQRRDFIKKSCMIGVGCCALLASAKTNALNSFFPADKDLDPIKLNYCGYTCPEGCEFRKASVDNDVELKKEAFKAWKIEERFGIKFEADKIYCYGCKNPDIGERQDHDKRTVTDGFFGDFSNFTFAKPF